MQEEAKPGWVCDATGSRIHPGASSAPRHGVGSPGTSTHLRRARTRTERGETPRGAGVLNGRKAAGEMRQSELLCSYCALEKRAGGAVKGGGNQRAGTRPPGGCTASPPCHPSAPGTPGTRRRAQATKPGSALGQLPRLVTPSRGSASPQVQQELGCKAWGATSPRRAQPRWVVQPPWDEPCPGTRRLLDHF